MTTPQPTPGSLADLLDKKQSLEGNVQSLTHLRDQLALALVTMEQNTDRITAWLKENREDIIVTRQQLMRAINSKKANKLRDIVSGVASNKYSKDVIGFLLSDGEVIKAATESLGSNNPEVVALNNIPAGMPAHLIEALPALNVPDDIAENITQMQKAMAPNTAAEPKPAEKPKGGVLSGWFKNQEQRDTEHAEAAYEGMLTHWRQIQRDLIGLQSDRHYYVDSFMDWVGENLSPSTPEQNFAAIMTQYRHPSYVIARAQEDYDQALKVRSKALLDDSTTYSNVAQLLDNQEISTFIKDLPLLFPRPDMPAAAEMRRLLLADFSATSFADIALEHVKKPADRLALFEASIAFEGRLKIKGSTKAENIYATVLSAVTDQKEPLPIKALTATLRSLSGRDADLNLRSIARSEDTLTKLETRFGDDDTAYATALSALLSGFGAGVDTECASLFVSLRRAALNKDSVALANTMSAIATPEMAADVRALWDMTMRGTSNTGISLTTAIQGSCTGNVKAFVPLLAQAISLGLARELTLEGLSSIRDEQVFDNATTLIAHLLETKNITEFSPSAISLILAASRIETDDTARGKWINQLKGNKGLITQVAAEDALTDLQKLNFIAALLSPVSGTIEKTALLENTAANLDGIAKHVRTAGLLRDAARALTGDVYPASNDSFLANPERIANIWYAADTSSLFFTLGGKTQVFSNKIDQKTAENMLDILHHRYGFKRESMGLFNPALADGFEHINDDTRIIWDMYEAPLNNITGLQRMELRAMPDMVHTTATDSKGVETHTSMRPRAILALIPMPRDNQWLMIDRNGNHKIVDKITMPQNEAPLVRMGNTFINPDRASLLSIDSADQTLSLRVENPVFNQLLEGMSREGGLAGFCSSDCQYIKVTASSKAQWQTCMDAINNNPAQLAAEGDLAHMRFNIDTLGFITAYADPKSAGIQYSHKNKGGVSGRIELDADMIADLPKIISSLAKSANRSNKMLVVPAGKMMSDLIVHSDHIHNIFYQRKDKQSALIMITEHSDLRPDATQDDAQRALGKIAKLPGWEAVDNRSLAEDLARLDLATMMYWDKSDDSASTLIGNRVVTLGMTRLDFLSFVAQRVDAASGPVAGILDKPLMRQFNNACASNRIRPQDLPAPRKSANPRDLFEQVTKPSHSDMGRNAYKKSMYEDQEYNESLKKEKSYNKHGYKGFKL